MNANLHTSEKKHRFFYLFAFLSGAIPAIPLLFPTVGFLSFVLSVPFCFLLFSAFRQPLRLRQCYTIGFLGMFGYFLSVFHWLYGMYPLSFLGSFSKPEAFFCITLCWLLLSLLQAVLFSPVFLILYALTRMRLFQKYAWLLPLFYSILYTLGEWCQNFTWMGVPWGGLATSQTDNLPILQLASLFGSYYITFVLTFVNAFLAMALLEKEPEVPFIRFYCSRKCRRRLSLAMAFLVLHLGVGTLLYCIPEEEGETVKVGVLQANYDSLTEGAVSPYTVLDTLSSLSEAAASEGAEILISSETILTTNLSGSGLQYELEALSRRLTAAQVVGAFSPDPDLESSRLYNSLFYIDGNGILSDERYDKRHPVPFGEYLPMPAFFQTFFPSICKLVRKNEIAAGTDPGLFHTDEYGVIGAVICFDSIYPALPRESVQAGAEWLLVATNDSWFSGTAALRQHLSHTQLRAVENGRYAARSAATGISAVVDSKGRIVSKTNAGETTYLVEKIVCQEHLTLYTQIGDAFYYLCLLSIPAIILFNMGYCRKKERKKTAE